MKSNIPALAAIASIILTSCGSNSSEKETTTTTDTVLAATIDSPIAAPIDTLNKADANVPAKTKTVFEKKYPKATNVKWESQKPASTDEDDVDREMAGWPAEEEGHNAWFHWQGNESKAYYDTKSNWVGTVDKVSDPSSMPTAVQNTISKEFKGYTIKTVNREIDNNRTAYEVKLDKDDERLKVLIDENGKVVKQKKIK